MKQPWLKFYTADWRSDVTLGTCSLAARGLWIEMLCVMSEAEPRGSLTKQGKPFSLQQIAALSRSPAKEVAKLLTELETEGVFSRDSDGTIYSRRLRRDIERAEYDKTNGQSGGSPDIRRGSVLKSDRVRPYKKSDAPEKTNRIFEKTGGKCFWCDIILNRECAENNADLFHVDHLVPVCDGGSNDEENLVPACAVCNHDRARVDWPTNSRRNIDPIRTKRNDPTLWVEVSVGKLPDNKAQKLEARDQNPEEKKDESSLRSDLSPPGNCGDVVVSLFGEKVETEKRKRAKPDYAGLVEEALAMWDETAGMIGRPKAIGRSDNRLREVKFRLRDLADEFGFEDPLRGFFELLAKVRGSPFLRGETDRFPGATIDWIIGKKNFQKIMEGNYDGKRQGSHASI